MKTGNQLRTLMGVRWVHVPFLLAFLGRLPLFMTSVALVLWTDAAGRSAVLGGFYVAVLNTGVAVAAPWLGHLADRRSRPFALRLTGFVQLLALGTLSFQSPSHVVLNASLCLLAGLSTPPISSALRSMVTDRAQGDEREAIFTGEAMVGSLFAILGPLVLSGFVLLNGAQTALTAGAVLLGGSAVALSFLPAMRSLPRKPEGDGADEAASHGALAPLRQRGFRALTVRMVIEAIAGGVEQVAVPAFAVSIGSAALTGPLWAISGGIGLAAGAAYAVRTWHMPKETLYCLGVTGLAVSYVVPAFADSFTTMVLALSAGTVLAVPVIATEYDLVARTVPETQRNSGFAIMTSAAICGTAIGAQAGGFVIVHSDYRGAFVFAAVLAGLAAAMSWRSRRLWAEPPAAPELPAALESSGR
ncbi:MFS transporter [Streptomyces sp. NPDC090126]|uniref:MFS transporter n=2 Tax=unclassified Streptomyces TaxID=2593676 RepID=UPI000D1A1CD9